MIDLFDTDQVEQAKAGCTEQLNLTFRGVLFQVFADAPAILHYLRDYFDGLTERPDHSASGQTRDVQRVYLVDGQANTSGADWAPVQRNKPSPLGLKEAYVATADGRWIHKVRTDMVMHQGLSDPMVIGDLLEHPSQVVNFINNQFLNHYQRQGYLLGHAAAFEFNGRCSAIAASSGGGKSTLMLRVLETDRARFLSNDRILFQAMGNKVRVLGVAKHPRVNPGTLVNSERLKSILPDLERSRFEAMPQQKLWDIEQKYDVLIPRHYGPDKVALAGNLDNLILLDWSLDAATPTALQPVDIGQHPEALDGLRKSPGPFYQQADGSFPPEKSQPSEAYANQLSGVRVLQLTGRVDFDRAADLLREQGIL